MKNYLPFTESRFYPGWKKETARTLQTHLKELQKENSGNVWETGNFIFDYRKTHLTPSLFSLFSDLLNDLDFSGQRAQLFNGYKINTTEQRAALHTALRSFRFIENDPSGVIEKIQSTDKKIRNFTGLFRSGKLTGITGKPLRMIVNIGIGGSFLGPLTVIETLADKTSFPAYFISNVDDEHVLDIFGKIDPETTLFVIVSKSFGTKETRYNALRLKEILTEKYGKNYPEKHFIAVTANSRKAVEFGIHPDNIFEMWDWIGGRYSLWSAAGISIPLALGYEKFEKLRAGGALADRDFFSNPYDKNLPVILAMISVLYNNAAEFETEVYVPYRQSLKYLPGYLQQLMMESNGKHVQRNGKTVNFQTGPIIWGETGTNAQHSFFQLLHQGTKIAPVHFLSYINGRNNLPENRDFLLSNLLAQSDALAFGKASGDPFKNFEGNRPNTLWIFDKISPENLGYILAVYEHKTFTESVFWNINPFDQFGVELGKIIADEYESALRKNRKIPGNPVYEYIRKKKR
jgi:glucose-6-phosphate isomerase